MPKAREDMIKPINQVSLGEKVYRARMEKRMSVNEVAGHLGISEIFLRQIEMGRKIPSLPVFMNMCNVLGVSPAYFLCADLDIGLSDPVQMAIDVVSECSPRQGEMMMAMLLAAKEQAGI